MALIKVGLIGTGKISDVYLINRSRFLELSIEVYGSLKQSESQQNNTSFSVPRVAHPDEVISDPIIDGILNLTNRTAHTEASLRSLKYGKHFY